MLEFLTKAFAPLFLIVPRLLGLRLLRDSIRETLNSGEELARGAASGDPASRALLAQLGPTVAAIMGGDLGIPKEPVDSARGSEATASLEGTSPFALASAPGEDRRPVSAPERKKRVRPKANLAAESPSNGDSLVVEDLPLTNNVAH